VAAESVAEFVAPESVAPESATVAQQGRRPAAARGEGTRRPRQRLRWPGHLPVGADVETRAYSCSSPAELKGASCAPHRDAELYTDL